MKHKPSTQLSARGSADAGYLRQLRAESARYRHRLKAMAERVIVAESIIAAIRAGIFDADAAEHFLDLSEVTIDDDGQLIGINAAIQDLQERKPHFFRSTQA